jgi:hypothetical protein
VAELRTKIRVRGNLWRVRQDDGAREWKLARMLTMSHTITYQEPCPTAVVVCQIETPMAQWHAETVTTVSASAVNSVALPFLVENVGETVDDAIVTVARSSGTVTAFSLVCAELGISLVWTGSMGAGHVLTIDAGAQTVVETGIDGYSGFSLVSHTAPGWLTLPYGIYTFIATVVGGNAIIAFNYYPQFN